MRRERACFVDGLVVTRPFWIALVAETPTLEDEVAATAWLSEVVIRFCVHRVGEELQVVGVIVRVGWVGRC